MKTTLIALLAGFAMLNQISCDEGLKTNKTKSKLKVAYLIPWTGRYAPGLTMGPVILKALDNIIARNLLPGYEIALYWRDTQCHQLTGVIKLIDIWKREPDLDVIIGDACSVVCYPASLLASAWNIPIISWGCTQQSLSDKTTHPTFSRVSPSGEDKVMILTKIVIMFGWKRVGLISDLSQLYKEMSKRLLSELRQRNITVFYYFVHQVQDPENFNGYESSQFENAVLSIKNEVRVLIAFAYSYTLQRLNGLIQKHGLDKGFAFIAGPDNSFGSHDLKMYENWITSTVSIPDYNEEALVADFEDPLFEGMPKMSPSSNLGGFPSSAGENIIS